MFAYPVGITERLRFTTGFLTLPQRQTPLVALQAADVDLLSGHRVGLDVGIDWNYVEYQARALGRDFRTRGARQGEQIQLLRRLFTQSVGDFPGRYHRADRAHSHPNRHPNPIWAGGIRRSSVPPGRPTRADDSDCRRRARRSTVARVAVVGCSPAVEELATIHARAGARILSARMFAGCPPRSGFTLI